MPKSIQWKHSVTIFANTVILKQLSIAVGIPFGLLALILALATGQAVYALYILGILAGLMALTWLFFQVVHRGKYDVEFTLDESGALCRTQAKQARKNRIVNGLTVALGLLARRPAIAGAGLLAQARQSEFMRWSRIRKVKYLPRQNTILLRGGFGEQMALFCTRDNYAEVERIVKAKNGYKN